MKTLLINHYTGSVDTKENWLSDYNAMKSAGTLYCWFGYKADEYPDTENEILSHLEEVVEK